MIPPVQVLGEGEISTNNTGIGPGEAFHGHRIFFPTRACGTTVLIRTAAYYQGFPMGPSELIAAKLYQVELVPGGAAEWEFSGEQTFASVSGVVNISNNAAAADQDGDGLLDCEETDGGIDVNCDGAFVEGEDILFSNLHDVPADPAIPDIYVEVDWADCSLISNVPGVGVYGQCGLLSSNGTPDRRSFEPPQEVFDRVEAEFARNAHNLHFVRSGPFPATMGQRIDGWRLNSHPTHNSEVSSWTTGDSYNEGADLGPVLPGRMDTGMHGASALGRRRHDRYWRTGRARGRCNWWKRERGRDELPG